MGILDKFFRKNNNQPKENNSEISRLIAQASSFADQAIKRSYAGAYLLDLTFGVTKEKRSFPLLEIIDRILQLSPDNPNFLFAKAETHSLLRDDETGQRLRRQVLKLNPDHFDASMREQYFKNWENIFTYPGWNINTAKMLTVMQSVQRTGGQFVQIVRDGLSLTLAILLQVNRNNFPQEIVDARWKPLWVDTPYGPIFVHYIMFKLPNGKIYRQEYSLSPYPLPNINQRQGNWLIRRFCEVDSIFLVVNDNDDVIFNFRFTYPKSVRATLESVKQKLEHTTLVENHSAHLQKAMQWYMQNSDIEKIPY